MEMMKLSKLKLVFNNFQKGSEIKSGALIVRADSEIILL